MFDIFAHLLSSITSFLFPLFASYKALKTSDPAQLTPWLMYWVVLACALLVESWTIFILQWIPFYAYIRLIFLLYLILPQTQGARQIYEDYIHPYLAKNESAIEEFIASSHEKMKAAGLAYFKQLIEYIKQNVFGLPASPVQQQQQPQQQPASSAQGYTQSLLARFTRPSSGAGGDFYSFLAGAVSAAAGVGAQQTGQEQIIPDSVRNKGQGASMSYIAAQRERLAAVMNALDRAEEAAKRAGDGGGLGSRSVSGESVGLAKSRSEVDFVKLDRDEATPLEGKGGAAGGWMPWGWGGQGTPEGDKKNE
ncbi:receptor expression-enhancing protein 2 [Podospora fimiseda]|uniref:Protein YOP1 n=1 Tax=Podospora fimiseda TaxID=252190 RepID=A0AAN7BV80_9PEZI|nr:receptor expression-enhancing protein 2 [Podospora fimiseda]